MVRIIYNPVSGKKEKSRQIAEKVLDLFTSRGIDCSLHATEYPGHAALLAAEGASEGARAVAAVGGDGTVSEAASGLAGSSCPLLIIPAGTGNDFCKSVSIPSDPMEAAALFFDGTPVPVDMGQINDRYFINEVGAGFDVDVLRAAEKYKKHLKGLLPYLLGVLEAVCRYRTFPLTTVDDFGVEKTEDATVFSAANGKWIGGGILIAPEAKADYGLLDLTSVLRIRKNRLPSRLVGLMRGDVLRFPETVHTKGKKIVVSSPDLYMNIDGDIVKMDRAEIRIVPGALRLFCPGKGKPS